MLRLLVALTALGFSLEGQDPSYLQKVNASRIRDNERMRSPDSPLALIGKFGVPRGKTTIGRAPSSGIQLPLREGFEQLGVAEWDGTQFRFTSSDGCGSKLQFATTSVKNDFGQVAFGDVQLTFRWDRTSKAVQLSLTDRAAAHIKSAPDREWFPPDEKYRILARWVPLEEPVKMDIARSTGEFKGVTLIGYAEFELEGKTLRLYAERTVYGLFIAFTDLSAPRLTYGGGRYMVLAAPVDGKVILDLNGAHNSLCAYNPYWACDLPPKLNRLPGAIPAGERNYPAP